MSANGISQGMRNASFLECLSFTEAQIISSSYGLPLCNMIDSLRSPCKVPLEQSPVRRYEKRGATHSCFASFVDFALSFLRGTVTARPQRCVAVAVCGSKEQYRQLEERIVSLCRSTTVFRTKITSL